MLTLRIICGNEGSFNSTQQPQLESAVAEQLRMLLSLEICPPVRIERQTEEEPPFGATFQGQVDGWEDSAIWITPYRRPPEDGPEEVHVVVRFSLAPESGPLAIATALVLGRWQRGVIEDSSSFFLNGTEFSCDEFEARMGIVSPQPDFESAIREFWRGKSMRT